MVQWHSPAEVTVGPAVNHRRQLSHGFTVTGMARAVTVSGDSDDNQASS
jgi:hypothetical protein